MLRLVTGPFHPTLESQLVDDLRALKTQDPQAALALIVPSDQLRLALKHLLVTRHGLALLNIHILSFHQLALQLNVERQVRAGAARKLELVTDVFFEELLRHLGRRRLPHTEALHLEQLPPGAWSALWASLRDLKDATVDPALAIRAVEEGQFSTEDAGKLKGLFTLYAAIREGASALGVGSPDDLTSLVTDFVPESSFLRGLSGLWYYGSYDLTQTQLTLLETLAGSCPVTVYFPIRAEPGFAFAQQFLERYLYPMAGAAQTAPVSATSASGFERPNVSVEVQNAVGVDDELTLVCKQILTLVESNGYRFEEIGVVGRTLAPYQSAIARIFDQHCLPFVSSAAMPLLHEPVVKTLIHLAQLKSNGLHRPAMLDVLTSSWKRRLSTDDGVPPRPDLWRMAVQALGITRGEEEWRRLGTFTRLESWADEGPSGAREEQDALPIDETQLRLLWNALSPLLDDVKRLPETGGYAALTDSFHALVERHLDLDPEGEACDDATAQGTVAQAVLDALGGVFEQMHMLDRLDLTVTWAEWTDTFVHILERTSCVLDSSAHQGVQVLDAMAARGVGFRALFVIGMNETVFPRAIHEDGFLRDRHRLVLSETLGYKIDQKLQGYGEEALLFELLSAAVSERLYLSYQRADVAGRPLTPSGYLDAFGNPSHGTPLESGLSLPRRWSERVDLPLFAPLLLTREELTLSEGLKGRDVSALLDLAGREGQVFSHGAAAQNVLEQSHAPLTAYDGMLQDQTRHWERVCERGLSPTALETYARCPFEYFAAKVLALTPTRVGTSMELPPPAMGQLCHDALRRCYQSLMEQGWAAATSSTSIVQMAVGRAVEEACAAYARTHGTGFHLTWEFAQAQVRQVVEAVLAFDCGAGNSGVSPIGCEVDATGILPNGTGGGTVPIRGRLDRIDRHPTSGALRVVDYKYRANGRVEAKDRNLLQSAVRAQRLQPALYALMALAESPTDGRPVFPEQVDFVYLLPQGKPAVECASFAASAWQGPSGPLLSQAVQTLLDGIRNGRHFIVPDTTHCRYCDYATLCRRTHQPTWWRAYRADQAKTLREIRSQKVSRD
ncbi:MAG: exodeoxyribonuclease V subunit gamma [Nitrospira sp.]|nr:exodeoxyribonuclease V subunit gamma [Nitrospira sp.]